MEKQCVCVCVCVCVRACVRACVRVLTHLPLHSLINTKTQKSKSSSAELNSHKISKSCQFAKLNSIFLLLKKYLVFKTIRSILNQIMSMMMGKYLLF